MTTPQNKIEIFGPKSDGSYWLELRQSDGQSLVVSVPASEAAVLKYFQSRMPYGCSIGSWTTSALACSRPPCQSQWTSPASRA